jgi:hypothetical protein
MSGTQAQMSLRALIDQEVQRRNLTLTDTESDVVDNLVVAGEARLIDERSTDPAVLVAAAAKLVDAVLAARSDNERLLRPAELSDFLKWVREHLCPCFPFC